MFRGLVFFDTIKQFFLVREDPRNGLVLRLQAFTMMSLLFWALRRLSTSLVIRAPIVSVLRGSQGEVCCRSTGTALGRRARPLTMPKRLPGPDPRPQASEHVLCSVSIWHTDECRTESTFTLFLIHNGQYSNCRCKRTHFYYTTHKAISILSTTSVDP